MATNGIISIIKDGTVIMKLIAGSEGSNAAVAAKRIEKAWPVSLEDAYHLALSESFGHENNLVVMDKDHAIYRPIETDDEEINERYFKTFSEPEFNPRWDCGNSGHIELINI